MEFLNYKGCVPIDDKTLLCYNKVTDHFARVNVSGQDISFEEAPLEAIIALRKKLDQIDNKETK